MSEISVPFLGEGLSLACPLMASLGTCMQRQILDLVSLPHGVRAFNPMLHSHGLI